MPLVQYRFCQLETKCDGNFDYFYCLNKNYNSCSFQLNERVYVVWLLKAIRRYSTGIRHI